MLHRERELRARMRWVGIVFGVVLVAGVVGVIAYVQSKKPSGAGEDYKAIHSKGR